MADELNIIQILDGDEIVLDDFGARQVVIEIQSVGPRGPMGNISEALEALRDEVVASAESAGEDAAAVAADRVAVAADKETVAEDREIVSADKVIVAADKGIVAADKAIVAADKATTIAAKGDAETARNAAQASAAAASTSEDNAAASEAASLAHKDDAEAAATLSTENLDEAQAAKVATETARDVAVSARDEAQEAEELIQGYLAELYDPLQVVSVPPSLDLLMQDGGILPSWFSRASSGTYFDAAGIMRTASSDTPRWGYDPVTGAWLGILLQGARTNTLLRSGNLTNASWVKVNCVASLPGGSAKGLPISRITANAGTHAVSFNQGRTKTGASQVWTAWTICRVSAVPYLHLYIYAASLANSSRVVVDTSNWSVVSTTNNGTFSAGVAVTPVAIGDGFYAVGVTATTGTETSIGVLTYASTSSSSVIWSPTGVEYVETLHWQLEQGAFRSSIIVTDGSEVTRAADVMTVPVSAFPWNATEGTVFAEFVVPRVGGNQLVWQLDAGSDQNAIYVFLEGATLRARCKVANSIIVSLAPGTVVDGQTVKVAFAWKLDDFASVMTGGSVLTDTSGTLPTIDTLRLGNNVAGTAPLFGWLARFAHFPRRLSNTELASLVA